MAKNKKASGDKEAGKKRDSEQAADAEQPSSSKQKKQKAEAEPVDAGAEAPEEEEPSADMSDDEGEDDEDFEFGEDQDEEDDSVQAQWHKSLAQRAEEMGTFPVVLGDIDREADSEDEDEDEGEDGGGEKDPEEVMKKLEAATRVFLPKEVQEVLEAMCEELGQIGCTPPESEEGEDDADEAAEGEDAERKAMFKRMMAMCTVRMLNTKHSYPMQEIIQDSLKEVDKRIKARDWKGAFCRWSATLMAASEEDHWFRDTDVPDVPVKIYKQLKKQWGTLKQHSDQELGGPVVEGGQQPSVQRAFDWLLKRLAGNMSDLYTVT